MEGIVYHGSLVQDLDVITRHKSTHMKECVYASPDEVVALIFMGKGHGDLDTLSGTQDGELILVERRPGVLKQLYDKSGMMYELSAENFNHYDYLWGKEVISFSDEKVLRKRRVENILDELNEKQIEGAIRIYSYPDRPENVPLDNSDLIEKYIDFEKRMGPGPLKELLEIYPEFKDRVEEILKGERKSM